MFSGANSGKKKQGVNVSSVNELKQKEWEKWFTSKKTCLSILRLLNVSSVNELNQKEWEKMVYK